MGISNVTGAGTTSFSFEGAVADLNRVLNDSILFTPTAEFSGIAQVAINVNDQGETGTGGTLSATETLFINVTPVNDPPTLDLDGNDSSGASGTGYQAIFTEGAGAVTIGDALGSDINISDVDDTNIESATITLTNDFDGASEFLVADEGVINGLGITVGTNNTDTITLLGTATIAEYQQALGEY